jgi:hypothetical protein
MNSMLILLRPTCLRSVPGRDSLAGVLRMTDHHAPMEDLTFGQPGRLCVDIPHRPVLHYEVTVAPLPWYRKKTDPKWLRLSSCAKVDWQPSSMPVVQFLELQNRSRALRRACHRGRLPLALK